MKILKPVSNFFSPKFIVILLFTLPFTVGAQSWIKAIGTKNQDNVNQFITLPDSMLYIRGSFGGPAILKTSNPNDGNLLNGDSLSNNFVLQIDRAGKIKHKFTYSGFNSSIITGDAKGNYIMAGLCANVNMPGDTFTTKVVTLTSNSWLENASIEMLDSSSHVKWHYLLQYRLFFYSDYYQGGFNLDTAWSDSTGNWYFLIYNTSVIIENDSFTANKDSNTFVLLKLDANGKYIWHKHLRNAKLLSVDKAGNILSYFDTNGFESNNIVLFDSGYHFKWTRQFYQDAYSYISMANFSTNGTILVLYHNSYQDSIYEYDLNEKLLKQLAYNNFSPDWRQLVNPQGFFVYYYSDNYYNYQGNGLNELYVSYINNGVYTGNQITYFTKYKAVDGSTMADVKNALIGPSGALYCAWNMNSDTAYPHINTIYCKNDSVKGFGYGDIVIARFSTDSNYLGIKPQKISQNIIEVYPNPAADFINLQLPVNEKGSTVQIYNMPGQMVEEYTYTTENENLNISILKPGVYIVKVQNEAGLFYTKFVKTQAP